MNLFAPERPVVAQDRKALLGHTCVVPQIYVFPSDEDEGRVMLTAFLPVDSDSYAPHHCDIYLASLPEFFEMYRLDPEETLKDYFAWTPVPTARKTTVRRSTVPNEYNQTDLL